MNTKYFLLALFVFAFIQAQDTSAIEADSSRMVNVRNPARQLQATIDTIGRLRGHLALSYNYKYLPDDDLKFNKRYPLWIPLVDVVGINVLINRIDDYLLNLDYAKVSRKSWWNNLQAGWPWSLGWEWDHDPFGNNFLWHPLSGNLYYNAARSNGYNLYEALPITFFGSYMWKIFGENGKPEREDLINTTLSGAFIGEVTYRLSSNILDDRTTGTERALREIGAGLVDPVRAINRIVQGKTFRKTATEAYQKEPIDIRLSSGTYAENKGSKFGTGEVCEIVDIRLAYGDPFAEQARKPFDFFKIRTELAVENSRLMLNMATGYAFLYGKYMHPGTLEILAGAFQHWDYYDDNYFELSTIGFGPGLISRIGFPGNIDLYTDIHAAAAPFGANTTRMGPYSNKIKDYDLVGGMEAKMESALDFSDRVRLTLTGLFFLTRTYVGNARDNFAKTHDEFTVINPGIMFRLFGNLWIGFEQVVYINDREPDSRLADNTTRTEQKLYLTYYSGNSRYGK
jgi:hypothetical protein